MPINRFANSLTAKNKLEEYYSLLINSYNKKNLDLVMCKNLISIDWRGYLYDCDFNQQIGLPLGNKNIHINDVINSNYNYDGKEKAVKSHCYGCTAGEGSSCGGALES